MSETIRIEHKPHLNYPYQVRVLNRRGKWVMLDARKSRSQAQRIVDRIVASRDGEAANV